MALATWNAARCCRTRGAGLVFWRCGPVQDRCCVPCVAGRAGWEDCPAFGHPLRGIIPSKVPLGAGFKEVVEAGKRYSPDMALRQLRLQHHDVRRMPCCQRTGERGQQGSRVAGDQANGVTG